MITDAKRALRCRVRADMEALSPEYRNGASAAVCAHLSRLPQLPWTDSVAVFLPLKDEPDIRPFLRRLLISGRKVWTPASTNSGANTNLEWRRLLSLDQLETGAGGFRQPRDISGPPPTSSLVLAPGVAFTRAGHRLGRGTGHYDRMLAGHAGPRVGVCFNCQVLPRLPLEGHDQAVDWVVTEWSGARKSAGRKIMFTADNLGPGSAGWRVVKARR